MAQERLAPEEIYKKALPSIMTLEVENFQGERFVASGLVALEDNLAVTAWHVVADARSVWAVFADGERVRVLGCIDKESDRDLAILQLEKPMVGRKLTLSTALASVASRAYVIGAPKGYGFSITDGLVSQIRRVDGISQYQVSCPISSGNSGGPVLNDRAEVIGIASWTKSDAQNVSFAVPVSELSRLNTSKAVVPWTEPAPAEQPAVISQRDSPSHSARGSEGAAGTLDDLKRRLKNAVGKNVTIVLREGTEEEKFIFTVPVSGLK